MAVVPIVKKPNPILDNKTEKVTDFGKETQDIIKNLKDTVDAAEDPEGAGLSANQIGVPKQICVVRNFIQDPLNPEDQFFKETVMINPKITSKSSEKEVDWEGCLSVPDTYGKVSRSIQIKVEYQDEEGKPQKIKAQDFFARVIQHEIDHLDGILFTSKVKGETVDSDYFENNIGKEI